ncbi:MAG: hypothetical protein PCFJNLEI_01470 [Verrucomicrobiae bacterium]|nr:hypothetical protein [Verrucomicrobiae bacterium]
MRFTVFLLLLGASVVRADTIHFTSGKALTGRVVGFTNGTFEYEDDKRATQRLAAGMIQRIEFDNVTGTLDTRTQGKITATIRRYDKAAFEFQDATGKDRSVPALMVNSVNFGSGGGSTKSVDHITGGDLEKQLVAGKVTIVDFYADWCGPCRRLAPELEKLANNDGEVALRKVNVDKNKQLAAKYGVRGIPHVIVFDKAGKNRGTVVGANIAGIKELVTKAKGKSS